MTINRIVSLRPVKLSDTENIVRWRNQTFVKNNLYSQEELTTEQHINYYHQFIESSKVIQFIISVQKNEKIVDIGTTFLRNIDNHSKKAEFGIFIGEQDALGKGYGKAATKQVLDYAFVRLKLNRVYLTVFSDNISAIKAYETSGFQFEGCLKQDFLRYDGFADVTVMGITKDIFENTKKRTENI